MIMIVVMVVGYVKSVGVDVVKLDLNLWFYELSGITGR
jgi:hypothetical protein